MKKYSVHFVGEATRDLSDLVLYIAEHDSVGRAEHVLQEIENLCASLSQLPMRGHVPPELERVGVTEYREVHFKPYRVIYRISRRRVYVYCVLDGRQDMRTALERRLLR